MDLLISLTFSFLQSLAFSLVPFHSVSLYRVGCVWKQKDNFWLLEQFEFSLAMHKAYVVNGITYTNTQCSHDWINNWATISFVHLCRILFSFVVVADLGFSGLFLQMFVHSPQFQWNAHKVNYSNWYKTK